MSALEHAHDAAVEAALRDEVLGLARDSHERILLAAAWVVARDGLKGLRMAAVAREAGVSHALLHYYFGSRRDLIESAVEAYFLEERLRQEDRLATIGDPLLRLRTAIELQMEDEARVRLSWMLWAEIARAAHADPFARTMLAASRARWLAWIGEQVATARTQRLLVPEVDGERAARRLLGVLDGFGWLVMLGLVPLEQAMGEVDRAIREDLGGATPRAARPTTAPAMG